MECEKVIEYRYSYNLNFWTYLGILTICNSLVSIIKYSFIYLTNNINKPNYVDCSNNTD